MASEPTPVPALVMDDGAWNERIKPRPGIWLFRLETSAGAMLALSGVFLAID